MNKEELLNKKVIKFLINKRIIDLGFAISPVIIIFCVYKDFLIDYFLMWLFVLFMGYCVYKLYTPLSGMLNSFSNFNNKNDNEGLKALLNYISFMSSSFLLAFAFSIIFYRSNEVGFIEYTYPAFVLLCTCRIMFHNDSKTFPSFINAVQGFTMFILVFAFLRLTAFVIEIYTPLGNISFISMNYFYISIPKMIEIHYFILISSTIWGILSTYENIKTFLEREKQID